MSFLFVLVLMTAYSIQKPVRDALAGDWGDADLALTWTVNFVFSVVAVSLYGAALSAFDFRRVVPGVYVFFSLTFLALWVVTVNVAEPLLFNKIFYVWVSIFSLFHLSVFWSFMADLYDRGQAQRLFGFIAAGTSAGAIIGPALTILLAKVIGNDNLMLLSVLLLLVPIPIILYLERRRTTIPGREEAMRGRPARSTLGRNPFSGFSLFVKDQYLLAIGIFILLYVTINTFVYFELQNLTDDYGIDTRTQIWATIELITNTLTLLTSAFVTSHIVTRLGMPVALGLMPALVAVGVLLVVAAPVLLDARGLPGPAAGRELRRNAAEPRDAVYGGRSRSALQGETGHRHRAVPRRRHADRVAVHGAVDRSWTGSRRYRRRYQRDCRGVDRRGSLSRTEIRPILTGGGPRARRGGQGLTCQTFSSVMRCGRRSAATAARLRACAPMTCGAMPIKALVERNARLDPAAIEDIDLRLREPGGRGQSQRGAHGGAARRAPGQVPGATVNRLCGSGMKAIARRACDRGRRGATS